MTKIVFLCIITLASSKGTHSYLTEAIRIVEKYSRGRRGAPAKGVGRATGARVQIPLSPFSSQSHKSEVPAGTSDFLCYGLWKGKIMNTKKKKWYIAYFCGLAFILLYLIPYFILGENASFRIVDFLDDEVIQYYLSGKYFFSGFHTRVAEWFNGADKFAIQPPCFLLIWPFYFLSFYQGVLFSLASGVFFAYTGMFLLIRKVLRGDYDEIAVVISFLFSILPFYPSYGLSSIGIPLVIWGFWEIYENRHPVLGYFTICFYGLYSSLVWSGYFVIGFSLLFCILLFIKKEKSGALRVFIGSVLLGINYLFVFKDTIYGLLFSGVESHRNTPGRVYIPASFKSTFQSLFKYGQYHAPSQHTYIMAGSLLVIIGVFLLFFINKKSRKVKQKWILASALFVGVLLIALFAAFYQSEWGYRLRSHLGALESIQFDRVYWLYPTIWYLEFAVCVAIVFDLCKIYFNRKMVSGIVRVITITGISVFMVPYLISKNTEYRANLLRLMGKETGMVTYAQYYDEDLFKNIKDYIGKDPSEYRVVCLGMAPAVASANGFYTLDAYSTNYSLDYKMKFREVIARELEKNAELEWYFDSWGNRCYLYSAELGKNWDIRKTDDLSVTNWEINTDALKELSCDYIFSAVEIKNAAQIGLTLTEEFEQPDSYRHIYLYHIM